MQVGRSTRRLGEVACGTGDVGKVAHYAVRRGRVEVQWHVADVADGHTLRGARRVQILTAEVDCAVGIDLADEPIAIPNENVTGWVDGAVSG
jgi:hypothetical protein